MKYCLVRDGVVENIVLWDGQAPVDFGDCKPVQIDEDIFVSIGYIYDGKNFKKGTDDE